MKGVIVSFDGNLDDFDHGSEWFLDDFRYRSIVQDGPREIRVDHCAEAKQDEIAEELRVISRCISSEI